ncbi:hypothetical protein HRTV-14_gp92 [Halorubrum phage HRTV-14]|uniref:Uncharacterized protein n=1 Tax=Halorubrum phage HRTV-14 TaxID=2877994 RepID=A0AAE9BUD7_9CAUD|nr:hypothetical protein HRTV-14_gp92 [Halorubrum phage HRTV-14]
MSVTTTTDEEMFEELFGSVSTDTLEGAIENDENTVCLGTYGDDLRKKNRRITWDYQLASEHPVDVQRVCNGSYVDFYPEEGAEGKKTRVQFSYFDHAGEFFDLNLMKHPEALFIHPEWNFILVVKPEDSEQYLAIAPVVHGDE